MDRIDPRDIFNVREIATETGGRKDSTTINREKTDAAGGKKENKTSFKAKSNKEVFV